MCIGDVINGYDNGKFLSSWKQCGYMSDRTKNIQDDIVRMAMIGYFDALNSR